MQELLWMLLPVAAASGWLAARRSSPEDSGKQRGCVQDTNPIYFKGLNHLLNEEPDKAIDAFVQMLEVDCDTAETHLALGSLFRRRGETERAIRIHQNLIARPALSREQRAQALLELGQDYMRAGLFDRAENLFRELRESQLYVEKASRFLFEIYQQERDWQACLQMATHLEKLTGEWLGNEKSHFHCELAEKAFARGSQNEAQKHLKQALSANSRCIRAHHLWARRAREQGDHRTAIKHLLTATEQVPTYLVEVIGDINASYKAIGEYADLRSFLTRQAAEHPDSGAPIMLADFIKEQEGDKAAADYLAEYLGRRPSLGGVMRLIELNARIPGDTDQLLDRLRIHLGELLANRRAYKCKRCGFEAKTLHWQCPGCQSWGSVRHRSDLDQGDSDPKPA